MDVTVKPHEIDAAVLRLAQDLDAWNTVLQSAELNDRAKKYVRDTVLLHHQQIAWWLNQLPDEETYAEAKVREAYEAEERKTKQTFRPPKLSLHGFRRSGLLCVQVKGTTDFEAAMKFAKPELSDLDWKHEILENEDSVLFIEFPVEG